MAANIFRKNLILCFSKIKCLPTNLSPPLTNDDDEQEEDDDDEDLSKPNPTTTSSASSFLLKNFNSLFHTNDLAAAAASDSNSNAKSLTFSTDQDLLSSSSSSDDQYSDDNYSSDYIPDFSTIYASPRFFFSSPGNSNSIIQSLPAPESTSATVVSGGVAIQTYSPNPYADFRRSMQEMVEAHGFRDSKADWEFLHELLLCYLDLNPKNTHKFIFGAFTDLIVSIMSSTTSGRRSHRKTDGHPHCSSEQPLV